MPEVIGQTQNTENIGDSYLPCKFEIGGLDQNNLDHSFENFLANVGQDGTKCMITLPNGNLIFLESAEIALKTKQKEIYTSLASFTDNTKWDQVQVKIEVIGQNIAIKIIDENLDNSQRQYLGLPTKTKWNLKSSQVLRARPMDPNPTGINWHSRPDITLSKSKAEMKWKKNLFIPKINLPGSNYPIVFERQTGNNCGIHSVFHVASNLGLTIPEEFSSLTSMDNLVGQVRATLNLNSTEWIRTPHIFKMTKMMMPEIVYPNFQVLPADPENPSKSQFKLEKYDSLIFNLNELHWLSFVKINGQFYLFDSLRNLPTKVDMNEIHQIWMSSCVQGYGITRPGNENIQ